MYYDKLLSLGIELGRTLMLSGAEIYRVEESITRLLTAYGQTPQVFVLPNCIILSITSPEGRSFTDMCRIPAHGTNIELLERCNDLCRALCSNPPDVEEAMSQVSGLAANCPSHSPSIVVLAYSATAAFFALFFGGSFSDFLCAALCGLAVGMLLLYGAPLIGSNGFLRTVMCSAVVSALAIFFVEIGLGASMEKITIGTLMVLVPGRALTNAMQEIMAADIFSGVHRTAEVILIAGAIALGTAVPLMIVNGLHGGVG